MNYLGQTCQIITSKMFLIINRTFLIWVIFAILFTAGATPEFTTCHVMCPNIQAVGNWRLSLEGPAMEKYYYKPPASKNSSVPYYSNCWFESDGEQKLSGINVTGIYAGKTKLHEYCSNQTRYKTSLTRTHWDPKKLCEFPRWQIGRHEIPPFSLWSRGERNLSFKYDLYGNTLKYKRYFYVVCSTVKNATCSYQLQTYFSVTLEDDCKVHFCRPFYCDNEDFDDAKARKCLSKYQASRGMDPSGNDKQVFRRINLAEKYEPKTQPKNWTLILHHVAGVFVAGLFFVSLSYICFKLKRKARSPAPVFNSHTSPEGPAHHLNSATDIGQLISGIGNFPINFSELNRNPPRNTDTIENIAVNPIRGYIIAFNNEFTVANNSEIRKENEHPPPYNECVEKLPTYEEAINISV